MDVADEITPPFPDGLGKAPPAVCSRWLGDAPCGALATHHVIWDSAARNGAVCPEHADEARRRWCFLGLHRYDPACVPGAGGLWFVDEDFCAFPDEAALEVDCAEAIA